MNYTITQNPYENESTVITTRGVMTDAKVAKLNNDKKKPALISHWENLRPKKEEAPLVEENVPKDYQSLLDSVGITVVNYGNDVNNTGAKKLRVNKIVNEKARNIYNNTDKEDVIPEPVIESAVEEVKEETVNNLVEAISEDFRGRHEKTAPIPVEDIKEAVKEDNSINYSRVERNVAPEVKQEQKAGDMDLYNNLLHSVSQIDDVSRQLQGARNQLSMEQEESRKLAEQYGEAVKELEKLKEEVEVTKKQKEQKAKEELSITLKSIENLQKENLERTSDLTSIQSEIARLKAEKQAMEANDFE